MEDAYMAGEDDMDAVFRSSSDLLDEDEEQKPFYKVHWFGLTNIVLVLVWTAIGVAVSMYFAGWTPLTAIYVMVQIVTTIGYGDMRITGKHGSTWMLQLFYTIWVFLGFGIVANMVSTYSNKLLEANDDVLRRKLRAYEKRLAYDSDDSSVNLKVERNFALRNKFMASFGAFLFFFIVGAVFYRYMEHCSCGYGKGSIDGCVEGDLCEETGGQTKNWTQCFYMSMITLTTVGFGDFTPMSVAGRWFALIWMVFGVLSAANFVGGLSEVIDYYKDKGKRKSKPAQFSRELFDKIDRDGNNSLSRAEFYAWMLVKEELVSESVIERLDKLYNGLDTNKTGRLEYEILAEKFGQQ